MRPLWVAVLAVVIVVVVVAGAYAALTASRPPTVIIGSIAVGSSAFDSYRANPSISNVSIKVNYVAFSLTPSLYDALMKGEVEVAIIPADLAGLAILNSNDTYVIALDYPLFQAIIVPANSTITSPAQLGGKTVAIPIGTGTYYLFEVMMKSLYNLTVSTNETGPNVVHVINVAPGEVIDAVAIGSAQAGVIWQPMLAIAQTQYHMRVLATFQQLWQSLTGEPTAPFLVWVATSKVVDDRPLLLKVLRLHAEAAYAWDRNETLAVMALERLYNVPPQAAPLVWAMTNDTPASLCITQQGYQELVSEWQYLVKVGFLSSTPNTTRVLTCSDLGLSP